MPNVLFICGRNRMRSPTAEQVFASWPGVETASAGLNPDADNPLDAELHMWADTIFVMGQSQRGKLAKQSRRQLKGKRIVCLDIPDDYAFTELGLVTLLKTKVPPPHLSRR